MKRAIASAALALLLPLTMRAIDATTVFNEVMYHPASAGEAEWIELQNQMAVNMDLSGWRITGGVNFTFPSGTTIAAGGHLLVASNPGALEARTGLSGVLGPWTGALDNGSETIRLENRIGREMDRFDYEDSGRFPVAADGGGVSLVKRQPGLASDDAENWTSSAQVGGTPGETNFSEGQTLGAPTTLSAFGATWNFNQTGANLGAAWAQTSYTAGSDGWQSGSGVFAFENDPVALPVGTTLSDPGTSVVTHYFQRSFTFSGDPTQTALQLSMLVDDGAVVFLNGFEVARINMPAGAVNHSTSASSAVENATISTPLTVPTNRLLQGANVLSVELHQFKEPSAGNLQLVEQGGTIDAANNLARAAGAVAFAKDVLPGYSQHTIAHLNDGLYGNNNSWIGNSQNSFCGISFGATAKTVRGIAWGRDNTGTYSDRTLGTYTVQYTTTPNPTASTPDSAWVTIGSVNYTGPSGTLFSLPSLRHRYNFAAINATGVRLICPGNGAGSGACIDELELYSNSFASGPPDVVFGAQLVAREIIPPSGAGGITINEISGVSDAVWRIELRNRSNSNVNVGGLVLVASNFATGYSLPAQTLAPGALLVLDETQLGFRPQLDDRVFLYNAARTVLLDGAVVRGNVRARSGVEFLTPDAATFGGENAFTFETGVVVNEVMYHFPPNAGSGGTPVTPNREEWIELHNRTAAAIDVSGWALDGAVEFTLPAGTSIAPGGFLVVAGNAAALRTKWPEIAGIVVGDFSGALSNSGERIVLKDAIGNPADEVRYYTGGAWPDLPDGGGSSVELRDPRADNANGSSWGASDESADTAWQTVTYRMVSGQTFGQAQLWKEFRIGMLGAGECLVDDVSVVRDPDGARQQLIQGGNFETLTTKWRMLGNHGTSAIETEPGNGTNHVLRVRATGQFGYNHNHIESTFVNNTALVDGQLYEVSFRARYVSGSNQLNTRAYYSRLARTTELALPTRIGTPGAPNSRFTANIGPTMSGLAHAPVLPSAGQPVTVTVLATDPDNVVSATLRYAFNGGASFASVAMTQQEGGRYRGSIPGQGAGTIVQFYVDAVDGAGAVAQMPAAGPGSRALYIVDDGRGSALPAHEMRVIMLPADQTRLLTPLNRLSDARIPGTAVYRRSEVFYNAGIRLQGTAAGRIRDGETYVGYDIGFPADHLFRGVHDSVNIDRSGRGPVAGGQDEIYVKHMLHRAGLPSTYDDLCYFIAPSAIHTSTAIMQMGGYERTFIDSQFNGDGTVFNLDGTYEPSTTTNGNPESPKNPVPLATQIQTDFTNLGPDKEQYRAPFEPRAGRRRDDFAGLIAFSQTMALPTAQLAQQIATRMDVDEWMRCAALYSLCGIGDTYMTGGFAHNLRVHVPSDGRNVRALPWDMDFVFSLPASSPAIVAGYNLRRVIELPANKRLYFGHLHDLCQQTFTSSYMSPWMAHYGSVVGQSMAAQAAYIDARRNTVLGQLPAQTAFAISTNGGAPFTVNSSTATLEGTGWVNIREFRRADTGAVVPATWLTLTTWRLVVALNHGENPITLQAYDFSGQLLGAKSITITSTLQVPKPQDFLRVTELNYHPAPPVGAELNASTDQNDFEFIELRNLATGGLDISGCRFTAGVDFTFPANTTLAAGESILVVRNAAAFQARYGDGLRVGGVYGPADSLANSGELIMLVDATGAVIQSFTYNDQLPWPASADGLGHSLVSVAPHLTLDRDLDWNWRASATPGGNPGTSDTTVFSGDPVADEDSDGLSALLEYALGSSETSAASGVSAWSIAESQGELLFSFTRRLPADDVSYEIETSGDFEMWAPVARQLVSSTQEDGVLHETHRVTPPTPGSSRFFVRLRVTKR